MRKCYYCLILKDRLKNFSNFSVTYSLLLKCPGFLCLFSTPCTNAVDGCDQGAFSENKGKGQQDCTGTLSAGTGNSCSLLCFISLPLSFSETKNLLSFWALKHQHLLWRRRYGELEIISVKVVPLTPM